MKNPNNWVMEEERELLKDHKSVKTREGAIFVKLLIFMIAFMALMYFGDRNKGWFGWQCNNCGNFNGPSVNTCQYCSKPK